MKNRIVACFTGVFLFTLFCPGGAQAGMKEEFRSSSSVKQVRAQIERLPADNIWWSANGEDMAWNNRNLQRLYPTVPIYREGAVRELASRPDHRIATHMVQTPRGPMGFKDFIDSDQSTVMGVVVLHQGVIVFEHYPRQQPYEKPIYWSVTKALVSTMVAILEDRGQVDVGRPIEQYVPELASSSFAGVTVRNILDMASGVDCPEEYEQRDSCYYQYSMTVGDGYWTDESPDNPYEYLAALKAPRWTEQGTSYSYSGVNTFILGWLVEKVMDMPFQDALSREIWTRIGAESDAAILAPRFGVPITHGGLLARLRDVARFGLLFTPSYHIVADQKLLSDRYINLILHGGNPGLLRNARFGAPHDPTIRHNVYQWDLVWDNDDFLKGGWAGQGLLINPTRDIVAVFTGYFGDHQPSELEFLPILREVLNALYGADPRSPGSKTGAEPGSAGQ